jgi:hypothetical protein
MEIWANASNKMCNQNLKTCWIVIFALVTGRGWSLAVADAKLAHALCDTMHVHPYIQIIIG